MRRAGEGALTGRTVLVVVLAFFGVVIAVNLVMVALALRSHPGVVAEHPYLQGIHYNTRVVEARRQAALGWSYAVDYDKAAGRIVFTVRDRGGRPVTGLTARARYGRPAEAGDDRKIALTGEAPGRYVAYVRLPFAGRWLVAVEATTPSGQEIRVKEELWRD